VKIGPLNVPVLSENDSRSMPSARRMPPCTFDIRVSPSPRQTHNSHNLPTLVTGGAHMGLKRHLLVLAPLPNSTIVL
jgi:hypothetical protein